MKLILIPDNPVSPFGGPPRPKVAISIPGDDHTIHDIIEQLVTPALVGMSFHPQTIQDGYDEARVMGARDPGESDDGRCWSEDPAPAPASPAFPDLPPVPAGYDGWSEPELCPAETKRIEGQMAFFHDSGEPEDHGRWFQTDYGEYGGPVSLNSVYFIRAVRNQSEEVEA